MHWLTNVDVEASEDKAGHSALPHRAAEDSNEEHSITIGVPGSRFWLRPQKHCRLWAGVNLSSGTTSCVQTCAAAMPLGSKCKARPQLHTKPRVASADEGQAARSDQTTACGYWRPEFHEAGAVEGWGILCAE